MNYERCQPSAADLLLSLALPPPPPPPPLLPHTSLIQPLSSTTLYHHHHRHRWCVSIQSIYIPRPPSHVDDLHPSPRLAPTARPLSDRHIRAGGYICTAISATVSTTTTTSCRYRSQHHQHRAHHRCRCRPTAAATALLRSRVRFAALPGSLPSLTRLHLHTPNRPKPVNHTYITPNHY